MDRQSVYTTHVFEPNYEQGEDTNLQIQAQLEQFILDFRLENQFIYRFVTVSWFISGQTLTQWG